MFQVSKLADYATVVLAYMTTKTHQHHNARDIALHTHLTLPTVSKVLKLLTRAGILVSTLGVKGGYSLANKPQDISITQVLQAIDGDFGMTDCSHEHGDCQLASHCGIRGNWQTISQTIFNTLQSLTLADMVTPIKAKQFAATQEIFVKKILRGKP